MTAHRIILAIALWLAVFGMIAMAGAQQRLRVVDGDTIVLDGERIRIFGLDCPEMRDRGGPAAKQAMAALLAGKTVTLKRRELDRYGRTVAKVFADGRDVTCTMIRARVCREFMRYSRGEYEDCR